MLLLHTFVILQVHHCIMRTYIIMHLYCNTVLHENVLIKRNFILKKGSPLCMQKTL